jgi:hypothetical protein
MNDNLTHEGPAHLFATNLLNDLMILLDNASKQGVDRYDENGEPIYDFGFWAGECAKALNVQKILLEK